MPELPEVETIVRELREAGLQGLAIVKAAVFWNRSIAAPNAAEFSRFLAHQTITDIQRRGKFIVLSLADHTLLIHLRMTGKFLIEKGEPPPTSHERVRLYLSDGRIMRYEDQRKFGKWYLANTEEILKNIGVEPLSAEFTLVRFQRLLRGHRRNIKPFLLDQHYIAGLGNIYADEALWAAKIHPETVISSLTKHEITALHKAIVAVLKTGIENTGTSLGSARANYYSVSGRRGNNQNQLKVFRREGLPCPRCQTPIQKIVVAQRGTHFCPHCQPKRS